MTSVPAQCPSVIAQGKHTGCSPMDTSKPGVLSVSIERVSHPSAQMSSVHHIWDLTPPSLMGDAGLRVTVPESHLW